MLSIGGQSQIEWPLFFEPMDQGSASQVAGWQYLPPYDFYNNAESDQASEAIQLANRENCYFAIFDVNSTLIGQRCFGKDGQVPGFCYDDQALDTGGGLRPDLTGRGYGARVIRDGLTFGIKRFRPSAYRTTVAVFNTRAQTVLTRLGFTVTGEFWTSQAQGFRVLSRKLD